MRHPLEALVEQGTAAGEIVVRSPGVGLLGHAPRQGEVLVGGGLVGRLTTLGVTADVRLPAGTSGRVVERALVHHRDPVEYGQLLLRLQPVEAGEVVTAAVAAAAALGLAEGTFAVTSPTHGMFYRRPSPDAPPYVECGQVVERGTTLGLVEVMKCFSAITYGGEGLPPRAEVVEVRASDGAEVRAEEVLFVVKPA